MCLLPVLGRECLTSVLAPAAGLMCLVGLKDGDTDKDAEYMWVAGAAIWRWQEVIDALHAARSGSSRAEPGTCSA